MSSTTTTVSEDSPLLKVVLVQRIIKFVSPKKLAKPLELANVCQLWAETSSEYFAAAHVWQHVLAHQPVQRTVQLYMLLCMAAAHGSSWIVYALTEAGISPKVGNPLNVAARYGHSEVVKMLLECSGKKEGPDSKLDFNIPDHGFTALQHAVMYKDIAIVEMLLNHYKKDQENFNLEALTATSDDKLKKKTALGLAYLLDEDEDDEAIADCDDHAIESEEIKEALKNETKSRKQIVIELLVNAGAKDTRDVKQSTQQSTSQTARHPKVKKVVKSEPLKCVKCKLKFLKNIQSVKCQQCDAPFCLGCCEDNLIYAHGLGKSICRDCSGIAK